MFDNPLIHDLLQILSYMNRLSFALDKEETLRRKKDAFS